MRKTKNGEEPEPTHVRAVQFEVIHFYDKKLEREIVILYSLGEDGLVREFTNGKWMAFPITDPIERAKVPTP